MWLVNIHDVIFVIILFVESMEKDDFLIDLIDIIF